MTKVNKAPIKVRAYAAGERLQILELGILHLIRERGLRREQLADALMAKLQDAKCGDLPYWGRQGSRNTFPLNQVISQLEEGEFIAVKAGALAVTSKGRLYMKQCSKRVRIAAAKIVCEVLDLIAEVI